jgi:hypothetical protein
MTEKGIVICLVITVTLLSIMFIKDGVLNDKLVQLIESLAYTAAGIKVVAIISATILKKAEANRKFEAGSRKNWD